jgi:phosphate/sulfate permease
MRTSTALGLIGAVCWMVAAVFVILPASSSSGLDLYFAGVVVFGIVGFACLVIGAGMSIAEWRKP